MPSRTKACSRPPKSKAVALFQYFPNNYIWNLSVNIAIESGAKIGEIEEMCRPLLEAAARGEDAGTAEFLEQWVNMGDKLVGLAGEDEEKGRLLSAGAKLQRAALYYLTAERMQGQGHSGRAETYSKAQRAFRHGVMIGRENVERFEIPYEGTFIPGLLTRAMGVNGPAPPCSTSTASTAARNCCSGLAPAGLSPGAESPPLY